MACEYELLSKLFHKILMPTVIFDRLNAHMMLRDYNRL